MQTLLFRRSLERNIFIFKLKITKSVIGVYKLVCIGLFHPSSDWAAIGDDQYLPTLTKSAWAFDFWTYCIGPVLSLKYRKCFDLKQEKWQNPQVVTMNSKYIFCGVSSIIVVPYQWVGTSTSDLWSTLLPKSAVISAPLLSVSVICAFSWLEPFAQSANTHCLHTCSTSVQTAPRATKS